MDGELTLKWIPRKRNYEAEKKNNLISNPCNQDPLKALDSTKADTSKQYDLKNNMVENILLNIPEPKFIDPLNQPISASETAFSLSKIVADVSFKEKVLIMILKIFNFDVSY